LYPEASGKDIRQYIISEKPICVVGLSRKENNCRFKMSHPSLRKLLYRLWRSLNKHRRFQFLLIALLMLVSALADVVSLGAVFPFIAVLTTPETVFSMPMVRNVAGSFGIVHIDQLVLPLTIIFVGITLLASAFRLLFLWLSNSISYATGNDLSTRVFQATLYQPYQVHVGRNSSEVISGFIKVNSAISVLFQVLTLTNASLVCLAVVATLIAVEPLISTLTIIGFGLSYASVALVTRRQLSINSQCSAL
jgi:ATP-binding cassette subfamily B protein